jgi:hypothetical protein
LVTNLPENTREARRGLALDEGGLVTNLPENTREARRGLALDEGGLVTNLPENARGHAHPTPPAQRPGGARLGGRLVEGLPSTREVW